MWTCCVREVRRRRCLTALALWAGSRIAHVSGAGRTKSARGQLLALSSSLHPCTCGPSSHHQSGSTCVLKSVPRVCLTRCGKVSETETTAFEGTTYYLHFPGEGGTPHHAGPPQEAPVWARKQQQEPREQVWPRTLTGAFPER